MEKTKKAVLFILENILGKEEIVSVSIEEQDEVLLVKIQVKPEAIGRVIGREGKTIKALRNILKIVSYRETGKKLMLDVLKQDKEE